MTTISTIISAPIVCLQQRLVEIDGELGADHGADDGRHDELPRARERQRAALANVATATMFCNSTPTRLCRLRRWPGRPSRIRIGSVTASPSPARVLMKPATKPVMGTAASSSVLIHEMYAGRGDGPHRSTTCAACHSSMLRFEGRIKLEVPLCARSTCSRRRSRPDRLLARARIADGGVAGHSAPAKAITAERGGFIFEGIEYDTNNGRFLTGSLAEGTVFIIERDGRASCRSFATRSSCRRSVEADESHNRLLGEVPEQRRTQRPERGWSREARRLRPGERRAARDGRSRLDGRRGRGTSPTTSPSTGTATCTSRICSRNAINKDAGLSSDAQLLTGPAAGRAAERHRLSQRRLPAGRRRRAYL